MVRPTALVETSLLGLIGGCLRIQKPVSLFNVKVHLKFC